MDNLEQMQAASGTMYTKALNMRLLEATPDRARAEVLVTEDMCTTGSVMHGGALMTLADFLGACGTVMNLAPGAGTTTLESKTNFVGSAPAGQKVTATCEPVHRGKSTQVWRTTITREDGRTVAVVTQTQMILGAQKSPQEAAAELFPGKSVAEQKAVLAQLEHAGAALYRAFAASEQDAARREELLRAAEKEEENARTLEHQA